MNELYMRGKLVTLLHSPRLELLTLLYQCGLRGIRLVGLR
jgi:hypothetical protein